MRVFVGRHCLGIRQAAALHKTVSVWTYRCSHVFIV